MSSDQISRAPQLARSPQPPAADRRTNWRPLALGAAVIVAAVFAVYWPALGGQFLWDDALVVHRNPLVTGELSPRAIWLHMDFPLSYVVLWLEWLAWGNHPIGYHVVNVLLHASGALLLWRVLRQMKTPAPWLAALLFAVHPLCVGSVAWISELKNTLSLPLFLLSLLLYLQADSIPRPSGFGLRALLPYLLSLVAFLLALLAKTSTVMLPLVLAGCAWWQRGRLTRSDWLRISPYLLIALAFGLMTMKFQAQGAISDATVQSERFWGRLAGAGMALWFYLGKALLPLNLSAIYPRWHINAAAPASYLPLLLWCGVLAICWRLRRTWGRHVLFGLGCFTVLLFPVLGFFDMYFLMLARVSDHLVYLPLTALVALAAGGLGSGLSRMTRMRRGFADKLLGNSSARSTMFIVSKPCSGKQAPSGAACFSPTPGEPAMPLLTELGKDTMGPRDYKHAAPDGAIPSAPGCDMSPGRGRALGLALCAALVLGLAALAMLRAQVFQSEEALWRDTLAKNPTAWLAHANLGWILASQQNYDQAKAHLLASLDLNPTNAQAHANLGRLLSLQGEPTQAEAQFQTALKLKPKDAEIRRSYAAALADQGRQAEAVAQLRQALQLRPEAETRLQLATLFLQTRNFREAVMEYCQVLAAKPTQPAALNNLAWLLATCSDDSIRSGAEAVRLAQEACRLSGYAQPRELGTLAAAYAEAGRFPDAVETAQKAVDAATAAGQPQLAALSAQLLALFRAGQPYHEPAVPPAPAPARP